jgi:hypothetical protein
MPHGFTICLECGHAVSAVLGFCQLCGQTFLVVVQTRHTVPAPDRAELAMSLELVELAA